MDSHHSLLLLLPKFSFLYGPQELTTLLQPIQDASLLDHPEGCAMVSAVGLSPVHFLRPKS